MKEAQQLFLTKGNIGGRVLHKLKSDLIPKSSSFAVGTIAGDYKTIGGVIMVKTHARLNLAGRKCLR